MGIIQSTDSRLRGLFLKRHDPEREDRRFSLIGKGIILGVLLLCVLWLFYYLFIRPADNFPSGRVVTIEKGQGLSQVASMLENAGVVNSKFWFDNLLILQGGEKAIVAGDYYFDKPLSLFDISRRLTHGRFGIAPVKVTIPEGFSVFDIAKLFSSKFSKFDETQFLALARDKEGYLFPDTYLFMPTVKADEAFALLTNTFKDKIAPLRPEITESGKSENDIITMASILEEEARTTESRKIVSGILWKRIRLGMPLQVDSTFQYINGKTSAELTLADLKIKSPYNTYINPGLPPTPISNPGLDSIQAALEPTVTKYLYFLTDKDGNMHYASTLDEHNKNKAKYLK